MDEFSERELLELFEEYKNCNTDSLKMIFDYYNDEFISFALTELSVEQKDYPDDIVLLLLKRLTKKKKRKKRDLHIRENRTVYGYMCTSIRNLCKEKGREYKKKSPISISPKILEETLREDIVEDSKMDYKSLSEFFSLSQRYAFFKEACEVSKLSETQQQILLLIIHEKKHKQISEKLGISYANVTNSKTRAIRKLQIHKNEIKKILSWI